jgi:hypothetical protein
MDNETESGVDSSALSAVNADDADFDALPEWWQRATEHFDAHDLGTYKPARLEDGAIKKIVESELEAEHGVSIRVQCQNATVGDDWTVLVDGDQIGTIGRYRSREGYTVFEMTEKGYRNWIERSVEQL